MKFIGFIWLLLLFSAFPAKAQEDARLGEARKHLTVNPAQAIRIAKEVYNSSLVNPDHYNAAVSCSIISSALQKDGDTRQRFNYDSLFLYHSRLSGDTSLLLKALNALASDLLDASKLSSVKKMLDEAEPYFEERYQREYCRWLQLKGGYAFKLFRMDDALLNYKKALTAAESIPDMNEASACRMKIGESVLYKGKSDSMHLVYQSLDYFEKNHDYNRAADAAAIIGFALQTSFNYDNALSYYQKAIGYAGKAANKNRELNFKLKKADVLLSQKSYDEAFTIFRECEEFYTSKDNKPGLALAKLYLGRLYTQTDKPELAEKNFDQADELNKTINSNNIKIAIQGYRMLLSAKMKDFAKADSLAGSAVELASIVVDKDAQRNALKKFKEGTTDSVYKTQADDNLASDVPLNAENKNEQGRIMTDSEYIQLDNLNVYTGKDVAEDSSVLSAANRQIHDLETKYRTRQIDDSLQNQKQETIIARQNLQRRNYLLIGAGILLMLLVAFGWLQFRNRKRAERDKEHIELLQNEIHHRVKNNLAVINRLVEVAGKNSVDDVPLSALKNRIKSIELLHKHLYSQAIQPGHISLQTYLEDLCLGIAATFESAKKISISVDANEDVKSEIAEKLGLIINELVTNSYKYAFEGKDSGSITIAAEKNEANELELIVKDNGIGFNKEAKKDSYGMKLIRGLSQQLDGNFSFENNNGTKFSLVLPV